MTHAVENIVFETAPTGCYKVAVTNFDACTPGVDYTYYLKIGGNRSTYQGRAPAGDRNTYVVREFCWDSSVTRNAVINSEQVHYQMKLSDEEKQKRREAKRSQ